MSDTATMTYDIDGHPELRVIQIDGKKADYTFATGNPPWNHDDGLRKRLEDAGWRYAYMIGIVEPESPDEISACADDRVRFPHLVRTCQGLPEWHSKEATTFVAEHAEVSREVAAAWLNLDWFGGGEV